MTTTPIAEPTVIAAPRVGLQVGHWRSEELPDELERLRGSTGAIASGVRELDVNLEIVARVAALLEAAGVLVDILPATVPPGYTADAFVAVHADGAATAGRRGFKLATPWRTSRASQLLLDLLTEEYAEATGMPRDDAITSDMRGYYAFSYRRHEHAIARTTPAVIVETGFLTSPVDRELLLGQPDLVATGIAEGILRYLAERDPADTAALVPPEFPTHRAASSEGAMIRRGPSEDAEALAQVGPEQLMMPFQERDGWLQVFVRGESRIIGWVLRTEVRATDEQAPLPSNDT